MYVYVKVILNRWGKVVTSWRTKVTKKKTDLKKYWLYDYQSSGTLRKPSKTPTVTNMVGEKVWKLCQLDGRNEEWDRLFITKRVERGKCPPTFSPKDELQPLGWGPPNPISQARYFSVPLVSVQVCLDSKVFVMYFGATFSEITDRLWRSPRVHTTFLELLKMHYNYRFGPERPYDACK